MRPDPRLLRRDLAFPDYVLDLRVATITALRKEGIHTLGDLIAKSPWDLLEIRNIGRVSLHDIQVELAKKHLHLKHDEQALLHHTTTTKES